LGNNYNKIHKKLIVLRALLIIQKRKNEELKENKELLIKIRNISIANIENP